MSGFTSGPEGVTPAGLNNSQQAAVQDQSAMFGTTIMPQTMSGGLGDSMYTPGPPQPQMTQPVMNANQTIDQAQFRMPPAAGVTAPAQLYQQAQAVFNPQPGGRPDPAAGIQANSQVNPTANFNDYTPMIAEMQQYVQSMQKLAEQMNQRFR